MIRPSMVQAPAFSFLYQLLTPTMPAISMKIVDRTRQMKATLSVPMP